MKRKKTAYKLCIIFIPVIISFFICFSVHAMTTKVTKYSPLFKNSLEDSVKKMDDGVVVVPGKSHNEDAEIEIIDKSAPGPTNEASEKPPEESTVGRAGYQDGACADEEGLVSDLPCRKEKPTLRDHE